MVFRISGRTISVNPASALAGSRGIRRPTKHGRGDAEQPPVRRVTSRTAASGSSTCRPKRAFQPVTAPTSPERGTRPASIPRKPITLRLSTPRCCSACRLAAEGTARCSRRKPTASGSATISTVADSVPPSSRWRLAEETFRCTRSRSGQCRCSTARVAERLAAPDPDPEFSLHNRRTARRMGLANQDFGRGDQSAWGDQGTAQADGRLRRRYGLDLERDRQAGRRLVTRGGRAGGRARLPDGCGRRRGWPPKPWRWSSRSAIRR